MEHSRLPVYKVVEPADHAGTTYSVLTNAELHFVPEELREAFLANGEATHTNGSRKTIFLTPHKASSTTISQDVTVRVSELSANGSEYLGDLSELLSSAYFFSRKQVNPAPHVVSVESSVPEYQRLIDLAETRNQTKEWGNGRGDIEGVPEYFRAISERFAKEHNLGFTQIVGDELKKEGFGLMHAVGRASVNKPVFVNLSYRGNPNSEEWVAFVGKGVCFDTGGLNIKTAAGMFDMFMDKLGAMTVLAAFQTVVREKLPINLTCSIGLVENSINENAYRPSDILTSRKGLTVEIGNTDAEGRLVLADCMNWTQTTYKTSVLIELSTLTGAMITALGHSQAGLYTNDEGLCKDLKEVGEKVHELSWHMPCTEYHRKLVSPKHCDLTNLGKSGEAGANQAAAFLKAFVEPGTKWVHLDIAGVSMIGSAATGWGGRLLVEYARRVSHTH